MRYIEELRNTHKGKEIWVIGAGPSIDDFPSDFFDDKISIALNGGMPKLFPACTYVHTCHIETDEDIRVNHPDWLPKCIFVHREGINWDSEPVIIMRFYGFILADEEDFKLVAKCIELKGDCVYIMCHSIAHTAIEAAAVFGAKKITLAGCEARTMKDREHTTKSSYHVHDRENKMRDEGTAKYSKEQQDGTEGMFVDMRNGTALLAKHLPHINISRYYYKDIPAYGVKKGYERVGGDQYVDRKQ